MKISQFQAIHELSSNSAAGPDCVPSSLLVNCATELAPVLLLIFSHSLSHGVIPKSWKRAAVIPIYKSGDKTVPSNYRPISLPSVICKVIERIIRRQVFSFLDRNRCLNTTKHGFRPGRSCLSALLDVFDNIIHMLYSNSSVDMVYLDFSKAFDKVDHGILLHKLRAVGITGNSGIWLFHFRTVRSHFVKLPRGINEEHPVLSGVPQGTVLGPLLFLIVISDIDKDVSTSKLVSFADNTRLYSGVGDVTACDNLQLDLNTVYDWASSNNMFFNSKKFTYVCCSSNVSAYKPNLYIDPAINIIGPSTHVLDLGVSMSSDCTFDFHISNLYKRCSNLAGWILRIFTMRDPQVMLTLYNSLVMSRLDYACQPWSPCLLKHVYLIEKVQRAFTKHITGMRYPFYSKRSEVLKHYSLQRRRERYGIIYVWKHCGSGTASLDTIIVWTMGIAYKVVTTRMTWRPIRFS